MKILIATNNSHKVDEISSAMKDLPVEFVTPRMLGLSGEVAETGETFLENARQKARAFFGIKDMWILADDSGLMVSALNGRPGVHSARYAGRQGDYGANNAKLIDEMKGVAGPKRTAEFVCTMVLLAPDGREWVIDGKCLGSIIEVPRGASGFGYDPLFWIENLNKTMAELSMDEKNAISHRGQAVRKLYQILVEILSKT